MSKVRAAVGRHRPATARRIDEPALSRRLGRRTADHFDMIVKDTNARLDRSPADPRVGREFQRCAAALGDGDEIATGR